MTCSFCGNEARTDRAFSSAERKGVLGSGICHDCVRDLYVAMIAAEMRPRRPARNSASPRSSSGGGQVIRLHPRKD
jgi:hypothetical protein